MCVDSSRLIWRLCLSVLSLASLAASAADVRTFAPNITPSSSDLRLVVIEGQIQHGDYEKFLKIVKESGGKAIAVYIFSAGGDFQEAMRIGKAVRALELSSHVPMKDRNGQPDCDDGGYGMTPKPTDPINCTAASAGFFIHIGGVWRGGNYLLVHRPYFEKGKFGTLPQEKAMKAFDALQEIAKTYMADMGVPKHIQDAVLGTSSDKGLPLMKKLSRPTSGGLFPIGMSGC